MKKRTILVVLIVGGVFLLSNGATTCLAQAPEPNPMEWSTAPYATGTSSITMMAALASDADGGIQYYFQNVTIANGSHDSGWQSDRTYNDTSLSSNTTYEYRVKARDSLSEETAYSAALSARTMVDDANTPQGASEPVSGGFGSDLNLNVDPFTGGASFTVPIALPPGRQGSEPKLSLGYHSGGGNGWCGLGWGLGLGVIQRDTRAGVPVDLDELADGGDVDQYDDTKGFSVAFGAVSSRLVLVDDVNDIYRAETDQAFLKFFFDKSNNQWVVTDKSGNKYYFGESSDGRMVHPDFVEENGGEDTFLWALERILDTNGNRTLIDYVSDANQLYLSKISYNGNINSPQISEAHTVDFTLEDRSDHSISYATGYRVETQKRLSDITVEVNDVSVRRYALDYEYSDSTTRSLLTSITMYGSSDVNSLPPITFEYQEQVFGFEDMEEWGPLDSPGTSAAWNTTHSSSSGSTLVTTMDINRDGLPDRVMREYAQPYGNFEVQLNNGSGFDDMRTWGPFDSPESVLAWNTPYGSNNGTCNTLIDINGDGFPDRIMRWESTGTYDDFWVQLNDANGFDSHIAWGPLYAPYTTKPWFNPHGMYYGTCATLFDINGDGLPDRVMREGVNDYSIFKVQLNNGSGFDSMIDWGPLDNENDERHWGSPQYNNYGDTYVEMLDINGDGLPDRVMRKYDSPYSVFKVQFNTGYGFEPREEWGPIQSPETTVGWNSPYGGSSGSAATTLIDINGDGLPDRVMLKNETPRTEFLIQINNGTGFEDVNNWYDVNSPAGVTDQDWCSPDGKKVGDGVTTLMDIDGDGLLDRVMRKSSTPYDTFIIQRNKGPVSDLLSKVASGLGGSVSVEYTPSTQYDNTDSNGVSQLGFPAQTVSSVTSDDGFGNLSETTYEYSRGMFDYSKREFRGFGRVEVTDPCGTSTVTYFHQGGGYDYSTIGEYEDAGSVAKKGIPFRTEVYGSDANLYSVTLNKVEEVEVVWGTGWYYPYIAQTITMDYEGTANYRAKATQSLWDPNTGNIIKTSGLGEVNDVNVVAHTFTDIGNDSLFIHSTYATLDDPNIINKIATLKTTSDSDGNNKLKEIVFDYNDYTGNVIESKEWLDTINDYIGSNIYEYDQYGNRTRSIDPVGMETVTTYDDDCVMYPVEVNTGSFITTATYDVRTGQSLTQTDVMGITVETFYDEFFRVTDIYAGTEPNGSADLWLTHIDYTMGGISNGISSNCIHQIHTGFEAYAYSDGLGRVIQKRLKTEPDAVKEYRATDIFYNPRGKVYFASLPYFSNGATFTIFDANADGSYSEYDALGRPWKTTPPAGDTNSPTGPSYVDYRDGNDIWVKVYTDPEDNKKKEYFDAEGRTVKVVEVVTGGDVEISYNYDILGRLVQITDDANNITTANYDSLGRKTDSNDLDMGYWTYEYDDIGRLVEQTDARGNIVQIDYDPNIDRIIEKRVYDSSPTLVETVNYTYDESDDSDYTVYKGLLYEVNDISGWRRIGYDSRGRAIKTTRYIDETDQEYTSQTAYDDAGRTIQLTYPATNTTSIGYSYDSAGNLIEVKSLSGTGAQEVFYEPNGFSEDGLLQGAIFGNGVHTNYTYYTNSKRRYGIQTHGPSDPNLINFTYTYDKVSNILSITDHNNAGSANCSLSNIQYDDLYRLTQAYSVATSSTISYEYNAIGNMIHNGEYGDPNYVYSATRPHAVTSGVGESYTYDACGNMITRGNQTLTYDERNRLIRVVDSSIGLDVSFGYDADGTRLWKKNNNTDQVVQVWIGNIYEEKDGETLCHVYAGDTLICSFEPQSQFAWIIENNHYLATVHDWLGTICGGCFGGGRTPLTLMILAVLGGYGYGVYYRRRRLWVRYGFIRESRRDAFYCRNPYRPVILMAIVAAVFVASTPELAMATPTYDPVFYYYHGDHMGSASVMTDRDGNMVQRYGYQPFGDERYKDNTQAFSVSNRYTNQVLDEDTGLYYYGARYYDAELARFIQADTIVPDPGSSQSLNRYSYVYNNPLKFTDPTGNDPVTLFIIIVAVSAGTSAGIAAATGGNIWKAALAGAIAGACGAYGYAAWGAVGGVAGAAAGGALSAVITGGDPLMAAATAAISATISSALFNENGIFGSFSGTAAEQHIKELMASTGVGALVGGISAEISGGNFGEGAVWGAVAAASAFAVTMLLEPFLAPMSNTQLAAPDLQPLACTMDLAEPIISDSWIGSGDPSTADEGIIAHESIAGDLNPPQSFWQRLAGGRNWKTITNAGARMHNFTLKRTLPQFEKHLLRNGWKQVPSSGDAKGVQVFIKGARRYVLRPANVGKTKLPTAEYLNVAGKTIKHLGKIRLIPE